MGTLIMNWHRYFLTVVTACLTILAYADSLTINGDFSKLDENGFPQQWTKITAGGAQAAQVTDANGQKKSVLEFALTGGEQTRIEQAHNLIPGRVYKVTFEAKCENLSSAGVYLTTLRWSGGNCCSLKGTTPWEKYEFTTSFSGSDVIYRLILFARKGATGKVWFRNVSVSEVIPQGIAEAPLLGIAPFAEKPTIDGDLSDAVWLTTVQAKPFVRLGKYDHAEFPQDATEVMLGYDQEQLYVAFRCFQRCLDPVRNELENFKNKCVEADGNVFKDDCVILFLQPDTSKDAPVYEFTANALGTVADAICRGSDLWVGRDLSYSGNARVKAQIGDGVFQVEMAIPWKSLGNFTPAAGNNFKILAGRTNHNLQESSVYFPANDGFHVRAALGDVKLLKNAAGIAEFNNGLADAGNHRLSCSVSTPLQMQMSAVGEDNKKMFKDLTLKNGRNQVVYTLPGNEYNSVWWNFKSTTEDVIWRTPTYNVLNSIKNLELTDANGVRKFSASRGFYPLTATGNFSVAHQNVTESRIEHKHIPELLAVDVTRFWPENDNQLYLAAGTLQPLQVCFSTPFENLANRAWKLHLILPEGFELHSVTAMNSSPYRPVVIQDEAPKHGKKNQRHYVIDAKNPQPIRSVAQPEDLLFILIAAPEKAISQPVSAWYYAEWDEGKIVEAPGRLELRMVDKLNCRQPRRFRSEMWGGRMVNFADIDVNREFLRRAVLGSGFTQLQNFRMEGLKRFGVLALSRIIAAGNINAQFSTHPEWRRLEFNGKLAPVNSCNALCTSYLLKDPDLRKLLENGFVRQMSIFDIATLDYESSARDGALSCYCKRCREEFAAFAKLDTTPVSSLIDRDYQAEWRDFMTSRVAELCSLFKEIAHANNCKLNFYSGYQSPRTLEHYSVDWRKLVGKIDMGSAGYNADFATISKTVTALKDTPLLCGVIAEPWHEHLRQKNVQVSASELATGLIAGGKGFLCYNLPGLDGRSFFTFSKFNTLLAEYEDLLYDGVRTQEGIKIQGVSEDRWMLFKHSEKGEMLIVTNPEKRPVQIRVNYNHKYAVDGFSKERRSDRILEFEIPAGEMAAWNLIK